MSEPGVYPTNVSDEEWVFVVPYLCLTKEDVPQRLHSLRTVFDVLRGMVRAGAPWRLLPTNLPPWQIVHQQSQRWWKAGLAAVDAAGEGSKPRRLQNCSTGSLPC